MTKKILFYDDASNFGGHELMTLRLVAEMARLSKYNITFVVSGVNKDLYHELCEISPEIQVQQTQYVSGRGQWLRSYFSIRALTQLLRLIRSVQPDLIFVVQGGIALSSIAILAGRLAGIRTLSYLPMTHDESMFAPSPLMARIRQIIVHPFYSLPNCLVTISPRMADYASRRRRGSVRVVENGIDLPRLANDSRTAIRSELGLQDGDRLFLMIGRIELWQKRHDIALEALLIARSRDARMHLLVVGSGPDEQALRTAVEAHGLTKVVHWRTWSVNVTPFYAASDVLILPSRYEGVPLVMLEAMYIGRRIIAADVDGMADMLPPTWLFPSGDAVALADLLCAPESPGDAALIKQNCELIAKKYTVKAFGQRFLRILDQELGV